VINDPKPLKGLKERTKSKDQHANGRSKSPHYSYYYVNMNNKVLMLSASPQVGDLGVKKGSKLIY